MKYKYIIYAVGDLKDEQIAAKLYELGLREVFVEKLHDIDVIIADQKKFADENFDLKFKRLVDSGVFSNDEMIRKVKEIFAGEITKSMHELFKAIKDVGVEMELPNYRIEKIICRANELLNI